MSKLFVHTLREDPSDAEIKSHKLLIRAGYVRKISPGIYTWLPFGLRILKKIENIVREEMNNIGATEVLFPVLLSTEAFAESGRLDKYGAALFRLTDRKDADLMLGPTNEETFTKLVKSEINSYKSLPQILFQIQLKYRDEERPRAGIMRGREFVMKDSYSFDLTDEGLETAYLKHRNAYEKIFNRVGVEYVIVKAFSGAMGGSVSEEFLAETPAGEDTFVKTINGDYAANVEAIVTKRPERIDFSAVPPLEKVFTDNAGTVDELVDMFKNTELAQKISAGNILKTLVYKVVKEGEESLIAIGIPGNRVIDEKRLEVSLGTDDFSLIGEKEFKLNPQLVKGFIGPKVLEDLGISYYIDPHIAEGSSWLVGADEKGYHFINCVVGRDFVPTGTMEVVAIENGDTAPDGVSELSIARGVEIAHIFQLGRYYADAFKLDVLDENGKLARVTMGSYGIGVSRLIAVLAEQMATDNSLLWPYSVTPYDVHLVIANKDAEAIKFANDYAEKLSNLGLEVLLDDRKDSPGVKLKDAELLGIPRIIIVGRAWNNGLLEYRDRIADTAEEITPQAVIDKLSAK